jgi:thiamine-monophosphate kinase
MPRPAGGGAPTVAEVGEAGLLERLSPWLSHGQGLLVGPGDDAAVWQPPPGRAVVSTTDSLVEGVHFVSPLGGNTAIDLGWRLLAVSLSDIAAMGGEAGPAFISLALPPPWPVAWVELLYQGLAECSAQYRAPIAGGNVSSAGTAVLTSTSLGSVEPGRLLRRAGAREGWQLALTGPVGAAAALLAAARGGGGGRQEWRMSSRPSPRLEAAAELVRSGVSVAIDVSDGVFRDAARLLDGSGGSGLLVDAAALPVATGIRERWPRTWAEVAGGGEDYELLFAAAPAVMSRACAALTATGLEPAVIGAFDSGAGLRLLLEGVETSPPRSGHEHFRA